MRDTYLVHLVHFPLSEARERLQMSQHVKSWEEAVQEVATTQGLT